MDTKMEPSEKSDMVGTLLGDNVKWTVSTSISSQETGPIQYWLKYLWFPQFKYRQKGYSIKVNYLTLCIWETP